MRAQLGECATVLGIQHIEQTPTRRVSQRLEHLVHRGKEYAAEWLHVKSAPSSSSRQSSRPAVRQQTALWIRLDADRSHALARHAAALAEHIHKAGIRSQEEADVAFPWSR